MCDISNARTHARTHTHPCTHAHRPEATPHTCNRHTHSRILYLQPHQAVDDLKTNLVCSHVFSHSHATHARDTRTRTHCSYQYGEMKSNNTVIICNGVGAAVGVFYLLVVGMYFKKKRELFKTYALTALSGVVLVLYVIDRTTNKNKKSCRNPHPAWR